MNNYSVASKRIPLQFVKLQNNHFNNLNEKRVLSYLRENGICSRPEIARHLGLSTQAILKIVEGLIKKGLLTTGEKVIQGPGQPSLMIRIANNAIYSLGVSIRQDGFQIILIDLQGDILFSESIKYEGFHRVETLKAIYNIIKSKIKKLKIDQTKLFGVGIALSGFYIHKGTKLNTPYGMEEWAIADLAQEISNQLNLPVWIENDAGAAAVGESLYGWGKTCKNFALIYIDYGLGGGVIVDGKLLHGTNGNAGEFTGLLPVEMRPQRPTLKLLFETLKPFYSELENIPQMIQLIETGAIDISMTNFIQQTTLPLTHIISAISAILDPDLIVLAGRMPSIVLDQMIENSNYFTLPIRDVDRAFPLIQRAKINAESVAVGAATLPFMEHFF